MSKKTINTVIGLLGLPVWIYFFIQDWQLALIILILMTANNASQKI